MWITKSILSLASLALNGVHRKMEPKIEEANRAELRRKGLLKVDLLINEEEENILSSDEGVMDAVVSASERRAHHEGK